MRLFLNRIIDGGPIRHPFTFINDLVSTDSYCDELVIAKSFSHTAMSLNLIIDHIIH